MTVLTEQASQWFLLGLQAYVARHGFPDITRSHLIILGNLDCGATYASAIAQRAGVSRQAIYKTVSELQALGILELQEDPIKRNQKQVVMTDRCHELVTVARAGLAALEAHLAHRIGADAVNALRQVLAMDWGALPDLEEMRAPS